MTDQGTEFFNGHFQALMKEEDIELYNTYNETKASIVERLIRTLKTKMWRYFTAKKTMRYIDVLPDLVYSYNHSVHRSMRMITILNLHFANKNAVMLEPKMEKNSSHRQEHGHGSK